MKKRRTRMSIWTHTLASGRLLAGYAWSWGTVGFTVGFLLGGAMTLAGVIDLKIAQYFFCAALILLTTKLCFAEELRDRPAAQQVITRGVVVGLAVMVGIGGWRLLESKKPMPSFVFVFPSGWFGSRWGFIVNHKGPEANFNVRLMFSDMAKPYMNRALTAEEIRRTTLALAFSEVDPNPEVGPPPSFSWEPITPDHEEFLIELSYRGGLVLEHLLIERVNEQWATALRVTAANASVALIECQDSLFPRGPWFKSGLRPCSPDVIYH